MKITSTRQQADMEHKINCICVCSETGNTSYIVCARACVPGPKGSENVAQFTLTRWNKNKENCMNKKREECKEKNNLKILQQIYFTHL